jgi:outer membrane lipoprotein-sorting protein
MLSRRQFSLASAVAAVVLPTGTGARAQAAAPLTELDRTDLARIESYLNGLRTLKARFMQVAPNGGISGGTAWIERPGRLRFEYEPPTPILLVAGHGLLVFRDEQLKQTTNLPLSSTPLSLLLQENIKLSGDVTVTGITRVPGQIQVSMVRTSSPADGTLGLVFADPPLVLRQWWIIDQQRRETRVSLFDIQLGGQFDQKLFTYIDPRLIGGRQN